MVQTQFSSLGRIFGNPEMLESKHLSPKMRPSCRIDIEKRRLAPDPQQRLDDQIPECWPSS